MATEPVITFHMCSDLFKLVDDTTRDFAIGAAGRVIDYASPAINVCLVLTFMVYGLMTANGSTQQPMQELIQRMLRYIIIAAIGTAGGYYQSNLIDAIQKVPDDFAGYVMKKTAGADPAQSQSLGQIIDNAATEGFRSANEAFKNGGIMSKQGLAWVGFAIIVSIATSITVGVGAAFIIVSKVSLALLAAVGPLFIYALLWKPLTRFFDNWINSIVTTAMVIVFIALVFSFLISIFAKFVHKVDFGKGASFAGQMGGAVILTIVALIVLFEVRSKAQALAGGMASGFGGAIAAAAGVAGLARMGAGGGGKGGGGNDPKPKPEPRPQPPPTPPGGGGTGGGSKPQGDFKG